jgi:hypothetical protein
LLVEGVFPEGRQTASDVEVMGSRQATAQEQSDCTEQLEHFEEGWTSCPGSITFCTLSRG